MTASPALTISRLDGSAASAAVSALAAILCDCVEGGASVSFLAPLSRDRAEAFWHGVAASVGCGDTILLAAHDADGIQGTVQLGVRLPENQPHRAEVAKLLVHRRARRRGVADALMAAAEHEALIAGKTLLTLDTASDTAARLYERRGFTRCGIIPDFALNPDRTPCDTIVYWKRLG